MTDAKGRWWSSVFLGLITGYTTCRILIEVKGGL